MPENSAPESDAARAVSPLLRTDAVHLPGPDAVDRLYAPTDRSVPVLRSLQALLSAGRLGDTGYVSILPVDQGIEHSVACTGRAQPCPPLPWPKMHFYNFIFNPVGQSLVVLLAPQMENLTTRLLERTALIQQSFQRLKKWF